MRRIPFLILASLALAPAAAAQTPARPGAPPMRESVRQACEADAQALCAGTQERERSLCLLNNLEKVSPACKKALGEPTARPKPGQPPAPKSNPE